MVLYILTIKNVTAPRLADIYLDIITKYGSPKGIVTDRGSLFTSAFWSEICYYLKIKRKLSTAFHPQTDGATERQNQVLEQYLRCYCDMEQSNWAALLPMAEYAHNNSIQKSTGTSPFQIVYGRCPEIRFEDETTGEGRVPAAKDRIMKIKELQAILAENYRTAVAEQQKYYNAKHKARTFTIGEMVLLSTKNLKQKRPNRKLSHKFIGPFKVLETVGPQAYRLALPTSYRIHPVFPVTLLEPYYGNMQGRQDLMLPPELINDQEEYEVEEVLKVQRRKGVVSYWVKWLGWDNEYNQWVDKEDMGNASGKIEDFESGRKKRSKRRKTG